MSVQQSRFEEASAFFAIFAGSPWKSCHLRIDAMEIFVSRVAGVANPMTGVVPEPVTAPVTALRASHFGTLVALAEIGTVLAAGQAYAHVELLGEEIELVAEEGGTVAEHLLGIGALAEYDQSVLSVR
jgi:biotin carboxyl carrier protein